MLFALATTCAIPRQHANAQSPSLVHRRNLDLEPGARRAVSALPPRHRRSGYGRRRRRRSRRRRRCAPDRESRAEPVGSRRAGSMTKPHAASTAAAERGCGVGVGVVATGIRSHLHWLQGWLRRARTPDSGWQRGWQRPRPESRACPRLRRKSPSCMIAVALIGDPAISSSASGRAKEKYHPNVSFLFTRAEQLAVVVLRGVRGREGKADVPCLVGRPPARPRRGLAQKAGTARRVVLLEHDGNALRAERPRRGAGGAGDAALQPPNFVAKVATEARDCADDRREAAHRRCAAPRVRLRPMSDELASRPAVAVAATAISAAVRHGQIQNRDANTGVPGETQHGHEKSRR